MRRLSPTLPFLTLVIPSVPLPFGVVTNTNSDNRELQLALKYFF
ncbi:MAG: hypothetical protein WA510_07065 [Acidobacteriaceae bacterium]